MIHQTGGVYRIQQTVGHMRDSSDLCRTPNTQYVKDIGRSTADLLSLHWTQKTPYKAQVSQETIPLDQLVIKYCIVTKSANITVLLNQPT
jgi:hypothetical protein